MPWSVGFPNVNLLHSSYLMDEVVPGEMKIACDHLHCVEASPNLGVVWEICIDNGGLTNKDRTQIPTKIWRYRKTVFRGFGHDIAGFTRIFGKRIKSVIIQLSGSRLRIESQWKNDPVMKNAHPQDHLWRTGGSVKTLMSGYEQDRIFIAELLTTYFDGEESSNIDQVTGNLFWKSRVFL